MSPMRHGSRRCACAATRIFKSFAEDGALAFLHSHSASSLFQVGRHVGRGGKSSISVIALAHALRGFRTRTWAFHNKGRSVGKIGQAAEEEAALADDHGPFDGPRLEGFQRVADIGTPEGMCLRGDESRSHSATISMSPVSICPFMTDRAAIIL